MSINRSEFVAASVASAALLQQRTPEFAASVPAIEATIDAMKPCVPVTPLAFGGYMEPATTRA